jgi:hypothetical protein
MLQRVQRALQGRWPPRLGTEVPAQAADYLIVLYAAIRNGQRVVYHLPCVRSLHMRAWPAEADIVMDSVPPVPHVLMHRAGHKAEEMTVVLGP